MYTNVLVPLDGSELAEQALPQAEGLVGAFGATLHLVQVISIPAELEGILESGIGTPQTLDPTLDLVRLIVDARIAKGKAYLEHLAGRLRDNGISVEVAVLEGLIDEKIMDYAKDHDVDCIVITTRGYSGLRRFLLGNVTDRVIRSSEIPVVVVPPRTPA